MPIIRQKVSGGFNPAEAQDHENPRNCWQTEGGARWQGQVQPVEVRHLFIQHLRWYFSTSTFTKSPVISSSIQVEGMEIPQSAMEPVAGTGVQVSITNAVIGLKGDWRVRYFRIV